MAAIRRAQAIWQGDLFHGVGMVSARSSGLFTDAGVTWASRTESAEGRTSPEELLAAAHASCFAMALSGQLAAAGMPPRRLDVTATVTFDKVADGFRVTSSALQVEASIPGDDEFGFARAVQAAKDGCPISKALAGNVAISFEASLTSSAEASAWP
ncbi:MAG: OsmC family peroxiredoxin [Myxococcales bacterium]